MPVVVTSLEETNRSILNNAIYKVVTDIARQLGIPGNVAVSVRNGMEISRTDGDTNVSINHTDNLPKTAGQWRVTAIVTEDYDEDYLTATVVSQPDAIPIFRDPHVDVAVWPIYVMSKITIAFNISSPSKADLSRIRDDIRVRLSQGRNIMHHETDYNYIIPTVVEDFISDVYDLKKRFYPQTLEDYFMSNSTKRMHMMTDMANKSNARIAIRENLGHIVGTLDFSSMPDAIEQDNDSNTYRLTIPYKLNMEYPRELCMKYPVMICNRTMPKKYLDFIEEDKIKTREEYSRNIAYSSSLGAMSRFEAQRQLSYRIQEKLPLNLPFFDTFPERVGHKGYVITTSFLTDVNETDLRSLMNLKETGEFYFDQKFLEHVAATEREFIINPYMSLFYIGLHQDSVHFDNNILQIDADLNVKSKYDLGLIRPTRITVAVCIDPTCLNPAVIVRMKENKDLFLLWLSEYVRCINNYKLELAELDVSQHTLYRFFILMLQDAINKNENDFVSKVIDLMSLDNLMIERLAGIMQNNTPHLYGKIAKVSDVENFRTNKNFKKNFFDVDKYLMRTLMNNTVGATRKENMST